MATTKKSKENKMSAVPQSKQPIVIDGWTWGLDATHSKQAAFGVKDLAVACEMADELMAKEITDDGELIGFLVRNMVLPFDRANQLAKHGQKFWQPGYYLCTRTMISADENNPFL
jgi:hypothetical protein